MDEQTALMNDEGAPTTEIGPEADTGFPPPHTAGPGIGDSGPQPPWYRVPVFRDTTDDQLGGVVAGVCRAYGFDRRTTRIALVLAALVLPVLVLVYILAWILLPDSPAQAQPLADIAGDRRRFPLYVALGLLVVVGGVGSLGSWFVFGDFPWGVGLIAIGVLLWIAPSLRRQRSAVSPPPPSGAFLAGAATTRGTPTAPGITDTEVNPQVGHTDQIAVDHRIGTIASDGSELVPPAMTPASSRRRRRIPIGSITMLLVVAFIAVASGGDAIGWWDIPVLGVVIASFIALAAGLAISAVVNGAWFFVPLVLILGAAAGFLVAAEPSLDGGIGERVIRPSDVDQAEELHDLAIGELTLDLVDVPLDTDRPVWVNADVGVGRLHVIVPAGAIVELTSEVGTGHVMVGDREVLAGVRHDDRRTLQALGEPTGTIVLDLRIGIGEIDIDRDVFAVAAGASTTP